MYTLLALQFLMITLLTHYHLKCLNYFPILFFRNELSEGVVQLFPADVLLIKDKVVIVQVYALVTSISPLRVYRHKEGHVYLQGSEKEKFVSSL